MLALLRRLLSYEFTIAELIVLAIILVSPYLGIGVIWAVTHTGQASVLGSVLAWPALLVSDVCTSL